MNTAEIVKGIEEMGVLVSCFDKMLESFSDFIEKSVSEIPEMEDKGSVWLSRSVDPESKYYARDAFYIQYSPSEREQVHTKFAQTPIGVGYFVGKKIFFDPQGISCIKEYALPLLEELFRKCRYEVIIADLFY